MRSRWMRTAVFIGAPLIATTLCTLESLRGPVDIKVTSESVTVGDIVRHVLVTGVLQPTTTIDVGTQVSGTIVEVDADFNSLVHTGQVLVWLGLMASLLVMIRRQPRRRATHLSLHDPDEQTPDDNAPPDRDHTTSL